MIRASAKIPKLLPRSVSVPRREIRVSNVLKASNISSSPKKGGIFKKLFALTLLGGGGVVGYSWYEQEFRKALEDNVPYAKEAFESLFEFLPSKEEVSKMIGGVEEVKPKPVVQETAKPAVVAVVEKTKKEIEEDKKREAERLLKERREQEFNRVADIEKKLQRQAEGLKDAVTSVMQASKAATEVTKLHCKKLKEALKTSEDGMEEWEEVTLSQENRQRATTAYEKLEAQARGDLKKLLEEVSHMKTDKTLKGNKVVSSTASELDKLGKELNNSTKQLSQAQFEVKVFSEYKDLVKRGKERFRKELEAIMPTSMTWPTSLSKMSEDELNALIGHAHKRIDQLQKRLAEQEALQQLRLVEAVERQKEEDMMVSKMSADSKKDDWSHQLQLLKAKWNTEAKIGFEDELKQHMIRQAAAHNEHINEVLRGQQRELEAKFSLLLSEHVQMERREFQKEVAAWVARMQGIEEAIEKRGEFEKQSHQVQRLWLACEALQTAIATGNAGGSTWQSRLKPLGPEVQLIKQSFPEQPAIRAILDSMPEVALNRGVWTEGGLIERFKKVDKVCRQVAMVDETAGINGSIFRYLLSSLQAKLVVPGVNKIYHNADEVVDQKELNDVFFLLDNAQACLDRGDMMQAVRFANQLSGEPRRAISDWLNEARLLLETKQLSTALLASASAAGFSSVAATT